MYKGANAHNPQNVIIVQGTNARIKADLMAKISQLLSILSFIISASMLGAGVYGYKMVTSDDFKEKMIQQVMDQIKLPEIPKLPKTTGGVSPFKI